MDLASQLHHHARTRPTHPAVIGPCHVLDYFSLYTCSVALAGELRKSVLPGHRAGIYCTDPIALAIAFHGCMLAGISAVILDPAWPPSRLSQVLKLFGSPMVLCDEDGESVLFEIGQTTLSVSTAVQDSTAMPALATPRDAQSELLVIFTSGSSGSPKAVMRSRDSWEQSILRCAKVLGATTESVTLVPGPLAHGLGLYALVESIATGGTLVASGRWKIAVTATLLETTSCNRLVAVPSLVRIMLDQLSPSLLASLRHVVTGGEMLRSRLAQRILDISSEISCTEYYGSSEHSLIAYRHHQRSSIGSAPHFVGTLFDGVRAHLHARQEDGSGRLMIDSDFNATGYDPLGDGELERCQQATGVGDLARLLPNNCVQILGRSGAMLNIHGNNIYPAEIIAAMENCGLSHPAVRLHHDGTQTAQITAYCLLAGTTPLPNPRALHRELKAYLPAYKVPHVLVFLPAWPLTNSGKQDLLNLPLPTAAGLRKLRLR